MQKWHRRVATLLGAAALAVSGLSGLAMAAGPASATTDTHLWSLYDTTKNLTTNGLGGQITMTGSGTLFYFNSTGGPSNEWKIKVTGTTDHCLTDSNTALTVQTCSQGDNAQKFTVNWVDSNGDGCRVFSGSHLTRDWAAYGTDLSGQPVWVDSPGGSNRHDVFMGNQASSAMDCQTHITAPAA